jgi:hypothetical protein
VKTISEDNRTKMMTGTMTWYSPTSSSRASNNSRGEIPDDDCIDYHDVEAGQGSPDELAAATEGLVMSAEQARMSRDGVQSLRRLVIQCEDAYQAQAMLKTSSECEPPFIKLRDGAEPVRMSARKYVPPQLNFMRDKIRELEELNFVYKNSKAEWASPPLILLKPGPEQYRMRVYLRISNASIKPTA